MKTAVINGKNVEIRELNFSDVAEMEDMGLVFDGKSSKTFKTLICLVSLFEGIPYVSACEEVNEHFKNGGSFDDFAPLVEELNRFFTSCLAKKTGKAQNQ